MNARGRVKGELFDPPIRRLTLPLAQFLHTESASGIVLLLCTAAAIAAANSPLADAWARFWETYLTIGTGAFSLSYPLWYWVNDGLMTIFFFLVGLEIKRELVSGELREARRVIAPAAAAVGGAAVPAAIFFVLQHGEPGQAGWAIPMATDIAFVVGLLALLGKRVPHGLKVFLLTLAIIDDIIAVLVIAVFYSTAINFIWLAGTVVGFGMVAVMNRSGIRTVAGYLLVGAVIWLCTLKSGIHPTISGVLLGFLTPATPLISVEQLREVLDRARGVLGGSPHRPELRGALERVDFVSREAISPLERLEDGVHPWSAFLIMPMFALANAGVPFALEGMTSTISIAIGLGLVAGKPVGILLGLGLVMAFRLASPPEGVRLVSLVGAGSLAGIGFTMSLFVASLSLEGQLLTDAKTGVLVASGISAVLGFVILRLTLRPIGTGVEEG